MIGATGSSVASGSVSVPTSSDVAVSSLSVFRVSSSSVLVSLLALVSSFWLLSPSLVVSLGIFSDSV
jgi:hypothetical protein